MTRHLLTILSFFPFFINAQSWQPVGVGVSSTHGFTLWDGKLAVAGSFNNPCNRIAAWDGSNYICLSNGVGLVARDAISFNGDLVVIGDFWNTHQPCNGCNGIARWDGSAWQPMGTGFNNDVLSITIWNGDLIVGGDFTEADGNAVSRIARWTGSTWVPVGGTNDFSYDIRGLTVYNGELWAGGDFIDVAGNSTYDRVVKWNGSAWIGGSAIGLPNGISSTVRCFYVDQAQNKLYMGGHFLEVNGNTNGSGVAVYNGTSWSPLGGGVNDYVRALSKYNGNIIVGGNFSTAGSVNANKIAKWNPNSQTWSAMGTGMNDYVKALEVYNGWLYAGGPFTSASGQSINGLARWFEGTTAGPVAAFTASDLSICPGQCVNFSDNSTGTPTTWTWTFQGGTPSASSSQNPGSVCFNAAGTYTVKLKVCNANGCDSVTQNVVVSTPVISAGQNVSICNGQSTTLNATGGSTYSWSPATGLSCTTCASPVATPQSSTTYTVTGTNSSGCSSSASVTVTVSPPPSVSAGSDVSICEGEDITLSASGGLNYTWNPSGSLSCSSCASPVASPSSTTTYTVTASNAAGCTASDAVTVTVLPAPNANAGGNVSFCDGGSVTLNASGGGTYQWSPAAGLSCTNCPSPDADPANTTVYTVTVTGANGCTSSDAVTVSVLSLPAANAGADAAFCDGESVTLNASGGGSYQWSPSTGLSCTNCSSPDASPVTSTVYTVVVTGSNGCSASDAVSVDVLPLPNASAGADQSICEGSDITLNGSGGVSYVWSPAAGLSCTACEDPVASPSATTTYTVTVTGANGCSANATMELTVLTLPVVSAGLDDAVCAGESVALSATGGANYSWSPATGLSCTSCQSPVATPASTTTYTVTGTDANGCSSTADVTITVNTLPVADAGADASLCTGSSVQLTGNGGVNYDWSPSTGLSCTACSSPVASPLSSTTYTLTVTDANGCMNTDAIEISVFSLPVVDAGNDGEMCLGESLPLNATGASSYSWLPSTGLSCTNCSDPVTTAASTITYTVTGTDANGCINTDAVTVVVNALPVADAGPDDTLCLGESVALLASGGISYTWSPADDLSCTNCQDPVATPDSTVTYSVVAVDANGCSNSDDLTLLVLVCTSVESMDINDGWSVFPNPASEYLIIESQQNMEALEIFNMEGKLVFKRSEAFGLKVELDVQSFGKGIYTLKVESASGIFVKKITLN